MKKRNQVRKHSFSLIEMIVVIAIMALVAGIAAANIYDHMRKARVKAAMIQIESLDESVVAFNMDTGKWPKSLNGLVANDGVKNWKGPYLKKGKKVPKDPWGNDYVYTAPGQNADVDIVSYGEDGAPGGEGYNKDLGNWDE